MTRRNNSASVDLAVRMAQWTLGTVLTLSLAFGTGLGVMYRKVEQIDGKLNYLLMMALGPQGEHSGNGTGEVDRNWLASGSADWAMVVETAEADTLGYGEGAGGRQESSNGEESPETNGDVNESSP